MLRTTLLTHEDGGHLGFHATRWLGVMACLCLGCPGVEPSETGTSTAAGGEGGRSSTTSSTGKGQSSSSDTSTATGMGGSGGGGGCNADLSTDVENCGECGRVCLDDDQVALPRCKDGVCVSFCESGFVNITLPETGPDDGCEASGRRAFVTEQPMTLQQLGGVMGADSRCQMLADALKLGGQWRAWISSEDNTSSVAERFTTQPEAPYMRLDFSILSDSFAELTTDFGLDHAIDLTESMTLVAGPAPVWTGTTPAGQPTGVDCDDWTVADGEVTIGAATEVTEAWTQQEQPGSCGETARLYCFEQ
jgi:hypothetical protein